MTIDSRLPPERSTGTGCRLHMPVVTIHGELTGRGQTVLNFIIVALPNL